MTEKVARSRAQPDDDTQIEQSVPHVLIPPGDYTLTYVRHQQFMYMGRQPKCIVVFKVMDCGAYFEQAIPGFYRVRDFKDGRLVAGPRSRLVRDLQACGIEGKRKDRLGVGWLRGLLVKGRVATVEKDGDGDKLHMASRYSVVTKLIGSAQ